MRVGDLAQVLSKLPIPSDDKLLVGLATRDDAAVYRLDDDRALVFTTDFFTPVVDDPTDFGRIAAANALSDVYAMGGKPILALNIAAFPSKELKLSVLSEILAGGAEVIESAGAILGGGHTIDDREPKYGLAVIGLVHPDRVLTKAGARPGDKLILTKPLGSGVIATAIKRGVATAAEIAIVTGIMTHLNAGAAAAIEEINGSDEPERAVHAVTDVTGFGLLGHLLGMLESSGVRARIDSSKVPILQAARIYAANGIAPGGTMANLEHLATSTEFGQLDNVTRVLLADAQTSGGLLIAVDPSRTDQLIDSLQQHATLVAAVIGEILPGPPKITVV